MQLKNVHCQYYNFQNTVTSFMPLSSWPIQFSEPSLNETLYLQIFSLQYLIFVHNKEQFQGQFHHNDLHILLLHFLAALPQSILQTICVLCLQQHCWSLVMFQLLRRYQVVVLHYSCRDPGVQFFRHESHQQPLSNMFFSKQHCPKYSYYDPQSASPVLPTQYVISIYLYIFTWPQMTQYCFDTICMHSPLCITKIGAPKYDWCPGVFILCRYQHLHCTLSFGNSGSWLRYTNPSLVVYLNLFICAFRIYYKGHWRLRHITIFIWLKTTLFVVVGLSNPCSLQTLSHYRMSFS